MSIKQNKYNVATLQYEELAREINAVLLRNHCSSKEYLEYIQQSFIGVKVNDKETRETIEKIYKKHNFICSYT